MGYKDETMARLLRISPPGVPQHINQRGNTKIMCFVDELDFAAYATWLKQYSDEFRVFIHDCMFYDQPCCSFQNKSGQFIDVILLV